MSSIYSQSGTLIGSIKSNGTLKGTISKPKEIVDNETVFILEDEAGKQVVGVLVDEVTPFDATPNDIRIGKLAVTNEGVTVGEKEIPAYHTTEGTQIVTSGSECRIINLKNCEYTKLQVLICSFNGSLAKSVATVNVSINGKVYAVNSDEVLAEVVIDVPNKQVRLGIINEDEKPRVIRYFTYKEIY